MPLNQESTPTVEKERARDENRVETRRKSAVFVAEPEADLAEIEASIAIGSRGYG